MRGRRPRPLDEGSSGSGYSVPTRRAQAALAQSLCLVLVRAAPPCSASCKRTSRSRMSPRVRLADIAAAAPDAGVPGRRRLHLLAVAGPELPGRTRATRRRRGKGRRRKPRKDKGQRLAPLAPIGSRPKACRRIRRPFAFATLAEARTAKTPDRRMSCRLEPSGWVRPAREGRVIASPIGPAWLQGTFRRRSLATTEACSKARAGANASG